MVGIRLLDDVQYVKRVHFVFTPIFVTNNQQTVVNNYAYL